jgi:predicted Na+-dependent transporter
LIVCCLTPSYQYFNYIHNEKFYKQYIYCGQSQVVPNVVRVVLVPVVFGQSSQNIKRNIERKKDYCIYMKKLRTMTNFFFKKYISNDFLSTANQVIHFFSRQFFFKVCVNSAVASPCSIDSLIWFIVYQMVDFLVNIAKICPIAKSCIDLFHHFEKR